MRAREPGCFSPRLCVVSTTHSDTLTLASPPKSRTTSWVPRLHATRGPGKDRALALLQAVTTVGRHATNDLVLPDPRVSGVHLHLTRDGELVRIRDAGSTNGTWLGPHRIMEAELALGAEITLGDTVLCLEPDDGSIELPEPCREAFGEMVGASLEMRELFATLERIAVKDLTLLVQGETGTGKEELARAVHAASPRASGPFVVVDCTSLPDTLAEPLLFGQEEGALASGSSLRVGFFEAARGGTHFLDEVGELPLGLQAKFLRVLERREIVRIGGQTPVPVDARIVAATNRDLRHEIDASRFREDLYFRLAQVRVMLPPLRHRAEDIPLLCRKLLTRAGAEVMIEQDALTFLTKQPWPGNVRELGNALLRASVLANDDIIRRSDLAGEGFGFRSASAEGAAVDLMGTFAAAKERAVDRFERAYLGLLMRRCKGNLSRASREADIARHHLRDLLRKRELYGVSYDDDEP